MVVIVVDLITRGGRGPRLGGGRGPPSRWVHGTRSRSPDLWLRLAARILRHRALATLGSSLQGPMPLLTSRWRRCLSLCLFISDRAAEWADLGYCLTMAPWLFPICLAMSRCEKRIGERVGGLWWWKQRNEVCSGHGLRWDAKCLLWNTKNKIYHKLIHMSFFIEPPQICTCANCFLFAPKYALLKYQRKVFTTDFVYYKNFKKKPAIILSYRICNGCAMHFDGSDS